MAAAAAAAVADLRGVVSPPPGGGTFAASARLSSLPAGSSDNLDVAGLALHLPVTRRSLALMEADAEAAPYGHGSATIRDAAVRDCLQVDADAVYQGPAWVDMVQGVAAALAVRHLGVDPAVRVTATLHKLLLYGPGGHFDRHADAEKAPGMFGTLALQLPVVGGHEGGGITVWRGEEVVELPSDGGGIPPGGWGGGSPPPPLPLGSGLHTPPAVTAWAAAWYADCMHRVGVVTRGRRVVLIYNLVGTNATGHGEAAAGVAAAALVPALAGVVGLDEAATAATPVAVAPAVASIRECLHRWAAHRERGRLLAIPLAHHYTPASFTGVGALKPADRALLDAVTGCEVPLEVHLVRLAKECHAGVVCGHDPPCVGPSPEGEDSTESDASDGPDDPPNGKPPYGIAVHASGRSHADTVNNVSPCPVVIDTSLTLDGGRGDLDGVPLSLWEVVPVGRSRRATSTAAWYGDAAASAVAADLPDVTAAVFGDPASDEMYTPMYGNDGVSASFLFHRAALVVWPAADGAAVTARRGATAAAGWAERQARRLPPAAAAAALDALLAAGVLVDAVAEETQALPPRAVRRRRSPLARLAVVAGATRATSAVLVLAAAAGRSGQVQACPTWDQRQTDLLDAGLTCADDGYTIVAAAQAVGWPPAVATAISDAVAALTTTVARLYGTKLAAAVAFVGAAAARGRDGDGGAGRFVAALMGAFEPTLYDGVADFPISFHATATPATISLVVAHLGATRTASELVAGLANLMKCTSTWFGTPLASALAALLTAATRDRRLLWRLGELRPLIGLVARALVDEDRRWRNVPRRLWRCRDRAVSRVGVALQSMGAPALLCEWGQTTAGVGAGLALSALLSSPTVRGVCETLGGDLCGAGAAGAALDVPPDVAPAGGDGGGQGAGPSRVADAADAMRRAVATLVRLRVAQTNTRRPAESWAMPAARFHPVTEADDLYCPSVLGVSDVHGSPIELRKTDRHPVRPAVVAFLRGPTQTATFSVGRHKDGRRLVRSCLGRTPAAGVERGWSVAASVSGRDGDAELTLVKTRDWWHAARARWGEVQAEGRSLRVLLARLEGVGGDGGVPLPTAHTRQ